MAARGGLWIIDSDDEAPEPAKEDDKTEPVPVSGAISGCLSLMILTPGIRGTPHESSTPREETQAKVTVKESPEQSSSSHASMSQMKGLLAKAHSDWMLSEAKTEPGESTSAAQNLRDKGRYPS